jgi:hypothetical protein
MPKYAKAVAAVLTAALMALSHVLPFGSTAAQWVDVALALLGALAVYLTPNAPAEQAPAAPAPAVKARTVKARARKSRASKTDPPAAPLP